MFLDKHKGFTLIELMVALAVLAILTGLAAPSFLGMMRDNRLVAQTNEFLGALHLARSEAVKRNRAVVVCKSADGETCDTSTQWHEGWLVWVDLNGNALQDSDEPVLRVAGGLSGENRIFASTGLEDQVIFNRRGMASAIGAWSFCDVRGAAHASAVVLNPSGRPKISDTLPSGGQPICL